MRKEYVEKIADAKLFNEIVKKFGTSLSRVLNINPVQLNGIKKDDKFSPALIEKLAEKYGFKVAIVYTQDKEVLKKVFEENRKTLNTVMENIENELAEVTVRRRKKSESNSKTVSEIINDIVGDNNENITETINKVVKDNEEVDSNEKKEEKEIENTNENNENQGELDIQDLI